MSKSRFRQRLEQIPPVRQRFVRKQGDIAMQLGKLLEEKGWTQRRLAKETRKKESYISRILSGGGNPTIKTVVELEAALDAEILVAPMFYEQEKGEQEEIDQPVDAPQDYLIGLRLTHSATATGNQGEESETQTKYLTFDQTIGHVEP